MLISQVAGAPGQPRHCLAKIRGVLAGTATDLEHLQRVREYAADNAQNGIAVVIARGGIRFVSSDYVLVSLFR